MLRYASRSLRENLLIKQIVDADDARRRAKTGHCTPDERAALEQTLAAAVLAASDAGVSWQTIGEALNMRRGAAYQRFRRLPGQAKPDRSGTWLGRRGALPPSL